MEDTGREVSRPGEFNLGSFALMLFQRQVWWAALIKIGEIMPYLVAGEEYLHSLQDR